MFHIVTLFQHDLLIVLMSTEKLLTRALSRCENILCTSIGLNKHTIPSDSIAQLVKQWTVVPEGASLVFLLMLAVLENRKIFSTYILLPL